MITDKEKLTNLLSEFGLDYSEKHYKYNAIILEANSCDKLVGYGGFVCEFYFDDNGKFIEAGVWE